MLNSLIYHRAGGRDHAVPLLLHRVSSSARFSFPVQPGPARAVHRREPAPPAGAAHPGLPDVPRHHGAPLDERLGTLLNSYWGLIAVNVAFQTGFCAFVLSNYMKALPREIYESAVVDGASVTRQFFQITLPLCRPPLAALATLEVTWIYNKFFWATVLLQSGDSFP